MSNITLIKKTKIMSNHGHALILSPKKKKKSETFIGW